MDDQVVDWVLGDVGEQALQVGAIRRSGTLTCIDKFLHHLSLELSGFPQASLTLGWDGVALSFAPGCSLFLGAHP